MRHHSYYLLATVDTRLMTDNVTCMSYTYRIACRCLWSARNVRRPEKFVVTESCSKVHESSNVHQPKLPHSSRSECSWRSEDKPPYMRTDPQRLRQRHRMHACLDTWPSWQRPISSAHSAWHRKSASSLLIWTRSHEASSVFQRRHSGSNQAVYNLNCWCRLIDSWWGLKHC